MYLSQIAAKLLFRNSDKEEKELHISEQFYQRDSAKVQQFNW